MAHRKVLEGSNPKLRAVSRPVKKINRHILDALDDMAQTMYEERGIGLAAPQIGVQRRMIVLDVGDGIMELINPEIIREEGQQREIEGCLSFGDERGYVLRPEKIVVRGLDRHGVEKEYRADGLLARVLAHEIDHLDGVLFVDKVVEWAGNEEEETADG